MICFLTFCSTCCQEQKCRQWQRHPVPSTKFWNPERRNIWSRFWMKSQSWILDRILAFGRQKIENLCFSWWFCLQPVPSDTVARKYILTYDDRNRHDRPVYCFENAKINVIFAERKIDFWFVLNQNKFNQFWWNLSAYQITNFLVYEWMRKGRHIFSGTSWGMIM